MTRTRSRILVNLAVMSVSAVVALLLAESVLRLAGRQPLTINPDQRLYWRHDPELGWAHRPGQEGVFEKPQFHTRVRINSKGLREAGESYARLDDRPRILVLGDSFAWGFGVEEPERFSERLETSMGVDVINAGVSGYSTDQELLWLRRDGVAYEKDLVLLVFCGNDESMNHLSRVYSVYYKPRFQLVDDELKLSGVPVPRMGWSRRAVQTIRLHSALADQLVRVLVAVRSWSTARSSTSSSADEPADDGPVAPPASAPDYSLTLALLDAIERTADEQGARFLIVSVGRWWKSPSGGDYASFVEAVRNAGFSILNVEDHPAFDADAMTIEDDGHWNAAGHAFVADRIRELIESRRLLDVAIGAEEEAARRP